MEDEESSEGYMFTPEQGGGTGKRRRTNSKDDGVGAETKNKAAAMGEHEPRPDPTSRKASRSRSRERQRDRSARDRRDKNDDRRQDNRSRRGPALRDRPRDNSRRRDRRERDRRRDHEQHRSGERAGAGSRRVYNNNSDSEAELVFLDERGVRRREKEGDASRREPSRGGAFSSHQPGHGSRSAAAVNGPPPHRDGVAASGADSSSLGAGTGRKTGTAPAGLSSSHESQSHANGAAAAAAGATTTTAAGQPLQANGDHAGNLNTSANLVVPAPIASAGAASDLAVSTANGGIASSSAAPAAGPLLRSPEEKDEQEDDNHNVEHGEQRQVVPASSSSSSNKLPPPSEYYGRQEWLESKRFYKYRKCKLQFQAKHAHNGAPQVHGGFLRDSQFAVVDLELVEKEERDRRSSLVVQDVDAVHPEIAAGHHDLLYARKIASWDVKYEKLPKSATDQTIEPVGQGAYGKVYKAKNRLTGELVAAKVTTKLADEEGGANLSFMREVQTMRRLVDCSACVRLVEMAVTDRGEPVIVMEYCHASLSQLLQSEKHSLTMANIKYLMQQVLEGVGYMHALGILHRDLATKNVLFNISGEIKVCDFGLSRVAFGGEERAKNLEPPQFIVTILYRSIELLLGEQNYGPALDIWGVGCILAEILIFKGGVSKKPFFYDESLGNNVNEMTVAAYVFQLLGRPTQKSWPDFPKLLKRCNFENFEAHIRNARPHKEHLVLREDPDSCTTTSSSKATSTAGAGGALALSGGAAKKGGGPTTSNFFSNEALNLKELFTTGGCKQVRAQLFIKESLFHLLGGMLNLDPAFRFTARKSLEDSWFGENPMPTWDAGRFANQVDVVTGAADTTREEKERRALVRMLEEAESTRAAVVDSRELQGPPGAGRAGGSKAKPSIKTAPPGGGAFGSGIPGGGRRNSEGGAAGGAVSAEERYVSRTGKRLPGNWERMWSRTNKKVFYANTKTRATQWHTPTK